MALSATFTANFASFYDAVDKADVKLKDFGAGADKVGGRLTALGNSFTGVKLIQDATLMVKAVEDIGGASKLTEKEMARLGATTNEAVAKLKALGLEVPENLQKIANQTKAIADQAKGATKATTDWAGALKGLAATVGIGFGVKEILDFGKAIVADAGHIADLSAKIGISAEAVQRFGFAASQTGASMDTIGGAITKMNVNLAGGDNSTVAALDKIGLQFGTIRAMKPEDAFTAIAQAIQQIPDPMLQAEAATALFGKTGAELLPAIKDGLVDVGNAASVMSAHTVEELDKAGDAWTKFVNDVKVKSAELLVWVSDQAKAQSKGGPAGDVENALEVIVAGLQKGKVVADDASKSLGDAVSKNLTPAFADLGLKAKSTGALLDDYALAAKGAETQSAAFAAAEKKAADAAAAHLAKIQDLAAALSGVGLTQKTKDLNEAVALNVLQYGRATLNTKATVEAVRALAREGAALTPLLLDIYLRHLDWAASGVKVQVGIKNLLVDLPNYTQQLKNFMSVAFANFKLPDFKTQIGNLFQDLPNLAGVFKAWGDANIKEPFKHTVEETRAAVELVATAFDAVGQHGGAAFQTVMRFGEIAATGMIQYKAAITDAERETIALQTTTAIATFGMTAAINLFYGVWKHHQDQIHNGQQQIHDLQQEILALGQTPTPQGGPIQRAPGSPAVTPMDQGRIDALTQQLKDFQAAQQAALDEQNKLNEAVQKYGLTWRDLALGKQIDAVHKQFSDLTETIARLNAAGYTQASIAHGMRDSLNDLVRASIETGQKIPPQFLPLLAQLTRSGDLADDVKRKLLGIADPAPWRDMQAAADKYGISIDALGQQFQAAKLTETAGELVKDWDLLVGHGADVNAVIAGMSGKVNDLVHDSLKFGVDIPANMKPMLQAMADAGSLTDENGQKLTDLTKLHFAADLTADFDALILKLDALIDKLGGDHPNSVAGQAETTAKTVEASFNNVKINPIHVPYVFDAENPPDFDVDAAGRASAPHLARGGIVTRPTFALIGEAGPEAVVPLGAGGVAPIHITVISQLDGREVARNQVRYIPRALSGAGI